MKQVISMKFASIVIISISTVALLMHILILTQLLPSHFVWGGRLNSRADVILFEGISIAVQILFLLLIAARAGYILKGRLTKTVRVAVWFLFILMVLNTLGNAVSLSHLETIIMTPITALLSLLLLRLAMED